MRAKDKRAHQLAILYGEPMPPEPLSPTKQGSETLVAAGSLPGSEMRTLPRSPTKSPKKESGRNTPFMTVLSRSMTEPALPGGGLLCAPHKYVPPLDGSIGPRPTPCGRGGEFGEKWPDGYVRSRGDGPGGTMIWPGNISHKRVKPPQEARPISVSATGSPPRSAATPSSRKSGGGRAVSHVDLAEMAMMELDDSGRSGGSGGSGRSKRSGGRRQ